MAPLGSLATAAAAGAAAAIIAAVVGARYRSLSLPSTGVGGMVMTAVELRIAALEEEAAGLHEAAKRHNLQGDFEGAKAAYRRMYAVEDKALRLAAESESESPGDAEGGSAEEAEAVAVVALAEYASLLPLPASPWADRATQRRALGAVLGAVVADAAAMGVHWVYDPKELDRLYGVKQSMLSAEAEAEAEAEEVGLDFFQPPQSPFFSYESGRASPYGEQTLALLASLVDRQGLHPLRYAEALARQFGTGWDGYRDASLKGFLRHYYRGRRPPRTGAHDWQANCFTRLGPVVAAYHAGGEEEGLALLLTAVERATRVTQNTDRAVAWARAGAAVLARVVGGFPVDDAVAGVVSELTDAATVLGGDVRFKELNAEIAGCVRRVHEMAHEGQSVHATVAALGRNCHLPNSFQTPLHAALLYSLPAKGGAAEAVGAMTAAERQRVYQSAVRAALREGGCCASRATYVGACLGAWLAGSGELDFLPPEWVVKVTGFERTRELAEALVGLRRVD